MDNTRTQDTFSQVKAETVMACVKVLFAVHNWRDDISETENEFVFYWQGFCSKLFNVIDYYVIRAQTGLVYQKVFAEDEYETILFCALFLRKLKCVRFSWYEERDKEKISLAVATL